MSAIPSVADIGIAAGILASLVTIDGVLRARHLAKQDSKLDKQDKKLDEIHILVNSRLTEALERIDSLEEALHKATGIPKELIQKPPPSEGP